MLFQLRPKKPLLVIFFLSRAQENHYIYSVLSSRARRAQEHVDIYRVFTSDAADAEHIVCFCSSGQKKQYFLCVF